MAGAPTAWQRVGGDTGGTVAGLAAVVAPGGPRSGVFAATPVGVFRSADGGASWTLPGPSGTVPFAEAVAPSSRFAEDRTIFACGNDGLYRSRDGGDSWQLVLVGTRMLGVATSSASTGETTVLAATETDGVLRSEYAGATWSGANAGLLDLTALCLAISPGFETDRRGFVGTAGGLYRTRNGAKSWRAVDTGLDDPAVQCLALSPAFVDDGLVLAGTEADGLLHSADGGTTWDTPPDLAAEGVTALAFAPGYPSRPTIAAATVSGVAISRDAGRSWRLVGPDDGRVLSVAWAIGSDGGEVLLAGLERLGVACSSDEGASWAFTDSGLSASLLTGLTLSPAFAQDRTLFAVGLDSGINLSEDAGLTWTERNAGLGEASTVLGLAVSPNYATDRTLFAATTTGCYSSRDAATTWSLATPTNTPARAIAVGPAEASAAKVRSGGSEPTPKVGIPEAARSATAEARGCGVVVALAGGGLLVSDDGALNWRPLTLNSAFGGGEILAVAVAPLAGEQWTLFVATSSAEPRGAGDVVLWRSVDGGERWSRWLVERGVGTSGIAVAVSPDYAIDELVFVACRGRVLKPLRHAREVHAGQRRPVWRAASLGSQPAADAVAITSLAVSPGFARDRTLFAASNAGVFVSRDAGESFQSWSDGLLPSRTVAVSVSPTYPRDRQVLALGLGGTLWQRTDQPTPS